MNDNDNAATTGLVWENPPTEAFEPVKRAGRHSVHHEYANDLKDSPGQWAKFDTIYKTREGARLVANQVKNGKRPGKEGTPNAYAPAGAFEAVFDETNVWARYIGENGEYA